MTTQSITRTVPADPDVDSIHTKRITLTSRHTQALSKLMVEREDLRGVHALADFVDDSLRWTA